MEEVANLYANRGVNLVRLDGKWIFRTAPDLGGRLQIESKVTRRLSRAALETLAVIAYHQPVTRAEIEEVRGVALSKGTLDTLLEIGWVRPKGRRRTPGRPVTWVTTDLFLSQFGLESLDALPGVEELRAAGLLDVRSALSALGAQALTDTARPANQDNPEGEDGDTDDADDGIELAALGDFDESSLVADLEQLPDED
jgi:segregation and condensation protein B